MDWKRVLAIKIRGFSPETASKNRVKRKQELKKAISKEIGKNYKKNRDKLFGKEILIDVCFYLYLSNATGSSKKDLDNLLKILLDVLSKNMVNGQDKSSGLGFLEDDSKVFDIHAKKIIVNDKKSTGLDLEISCR